MTLKKLKIINIFILFALSFLFHFAYEMIPNFLTSIFFPVNESIWEHMKLIFTPITITILTDYLLTKKFNIKANNIIFSNFYSSIISIMLYLIIYLPIDKFIGHSTIFAIILLLIIFIISQIISYNLMLKKQDTYLKYISIILIIVMYTIFGLLTYYPLKHEIFLNRQTNTYGIKK